MNTDKQKPEEYPYGDGDIPEIDLPGSSNVWTDIPPEFGAGERGEPLERPQHTETE